MTQPRIKIISDGISKDTQVLYGDGDNWIDLAGVVSEITWHLTAWGDPASATLHIALPQLEAAAENIKVIINQFLPSITAYPLRCKDCGWVGRVGKAISDIDDEGGLGCPECGRLLDSYIPSPPPEQPRDKAGY